MITEDTVFILGAGASAPYGFPTGKELRANICKNFVGKMRSLAKKAKRELAFVDDIGKEADIFIKAFCTSPIRSIDLFLARSSGFAQMGKQAIVLHILEAEKESVFREDMEEKEIEDWYSLLFRRMTEKLVDPEGYKRFAENKVSFVTFNYDRSLEHFLFESLSNSFFFAPKENIIEQVEKIPIFHVYGALGGGLAWNRRSLSYGAELILGLVDELSKNIRIVYETEEAAKEELQKAQDRIGNADRVFFLGFGYAEENNNVLQLDRVLTGHQIIYGTARGFSEREIKQVYNQLRKGFKEDAPHNAGANPTIRDMDCVKLLREFL